MGKDLVELRQHITGCEAEFQRRLARFDSGEGYAASGALSPKPWLRWQCNLSRAVASDRVEVLRLMASLPETTKAFSDGETSYPDAAMIARTALSPCTFRHQMDPDAVLDDANEAHELRFLSLSQTLDGVFYLNGRLDPEGGATLQTALGALSGPPAQDDRRTPKQRRADSLVGLARRQLDRGDQPEVGGQRAHLAVTVEMATLTNQPGSPAAELAWAQLVPAETAKRLACDAVVTPILLGSELNQPHEGNAMRVPTGSQRKALVVRDRGCRFPCCDMPPDWTDAHHIQHWADGGKREMDNLVLLCRRHHRMVHEERWRLVWNQDRELVPIPP